MPVLRVDHVTVQDVLPGVRPVTETSLKKRSAVYAKFVLGMSATVLYFERRRMKKQYLHLSAYPCDKCQGPVVSGSVAVRENEISKETDVREIGAICLSCGHRQREAGNASFTRQFPPREWEPIRSLDPLKITTHIELDRVSRD